MRSRAAAGVAHLDRLGATKLVTMTAPVPTTVATPRHGTPADAVGIELRGVCKTVPGGVQALAPINLTIAPGEFVSILGPSGCGKSTLLRIIAGLERSDSGSLSASGDGAIAYVFQDAHLLPWRTVLSNVALPLELRGEPHRRRLTEAREVIDHVGLSDAIKRFPAQLSGGMRMRVSLARALVTHPRLLLLDEPFAALDEITRQRLDEQLYQLWRQHGMTVIFVTHSTSEAAYLSHRAIVLTRRPGRVMLDTPIELPVDRPASLRGEPAFARETRKLYDALELGER
jgi:NitT/TauT family transport system ATP-binding protein